METAHAAHHCVVVSPHALPREAAAERSALPGDPLAGRLPDAFGACCKGCFRWSRARLMRSGSLSYPQPCGSSDVFICSELGAGNCPRGSRACRCCVFYAEPLNRARDAHVNSLLSE